MVDGFSQSHIQVVVYLDKTFIRRVLIKKGYLYVYWVKFYKNTMYFTIFTRDSFDTFILVNKNLVLPTLDIIPRSMIPMLLTHLVHFVISQNCSYLLYESLYIEMSLSILLCKKGVLDVQTGRFV